MISEENKLPAVLFLSGKVSVICALICSSSHRAISGFLYSFAGFLLILCVYNCMKTMKKQNEDIA